MNAGKTSMTRYLISRLVQSIFVLLGVSLVVFLLLRLAPGDPARALLPEGATNEELQAARVQLGLDRPLPVQYAIFMRGLFQGDLGDSIMQRQPALGLVLDRLPATFQLTAAAFVVAVSIAVPAGIISAIRRDRPIDYLTSALALLGQSMPVYWLGLVLILVFSVQLRWLPTSGYGLRNVVLPAITLGAYLMALTARLVRSGMLDTLAEDYVRTARSKGLGERVVVLRHAFRNSLIPLVTVLGLQFGTLLGGAVVTETVFSWPGVGTLAITAIAQRDYPIVQAVVLVVSACFVLINLAVDVLYAVIDPRVRYG
jgi:ABC-type dipeptide/oligopeptide/nickel transport system permease component